MFKSLLIILVCSLTLVSCKNNAKVNDPALSGLEKEFESNSNEENYNKLVSKYLEIIQSSEKGKDISEVLLKATQAAVKMKKTDHELLFTNNLVKSYPERADSKNNIVRMIELLRLNNKSTTADVLAYSLIKAYPNDPLISEIKSKLPKTSTPEDYIMEIGQSIFMDTVKGFDDTKAMAYVDACEAFAMVLPKDPQASEYLFKAAETSSTLKTFEKSFALYDWIIEKYPNSNKAPVALFMKGFIFDGTLKDSANAAKYYKEFVSKYPSSPFAKDAQILLSNLGKTDEEVLESLKNQSNSGK
ncbi:MAG: hypothetical protein HOP11_14870 [Saprospiraceae bacterium]|nr:hypothetical protein [Saprospiraceae bacterium]